MNQERPEAWWAPSLVKIDTFVSNIQINHGGLGGELTPHPGFPGIDLAVAASVFAFLYAVSN